MCETPQCEITNVDFTEEIPVKLDGIEIVGVQTFQSCNPKVDYEAQFSKSKTLTETSSITESTEESFTSSTELSVSATFTFGKEGVASQAVSFGLSQTFSKSTTKGFSSSKSVSTEQSTSNSGKVTFKGPKGGKRQSLNILIHKTRELLRPLIEPFFF